MAVLHSLRRIRHYLSKDIFYSRIKANGIPLYRANNDLLRSIAGQTMEILIRHGVCCGLSRRSMADPSLGPT